MTLWKSMAYWRMSNRDYVANFLGSFSNHDSLWSINRWPEKLLQALSGNATWKNCITPPSTSPHIRLFCVLPSASCHYTHDQFLKDLIDSFKHSNLKTYRLSVNFYFCSDIRISDFLVFRFCGLSNSAAVHRFFEYRIFGPWRNWILRNML